MPVDMESEIIYVTARRDPNDTVDTYTWESSRMGSLCLDGQFRYSKQWP
jgi:hypothetical protein